MGAIVDGGAFVEPTRTRRIQGPCPPPRRRAPVEAEPDEDNKLSDEWAEWYIGLPDSGGWLHTDVETMGEAFETSVSEASADCMDPPDIACRTTPAHIRAMRRTLLPQNT